MSQRRQPVAGRPAVGSVAVLLFVLGCSLACAAPTTKGSAIGGMRDAGDKLDLSIDVPPVDSRERLSELLGTMSFVIWLFAQSPQLYENYINSSCEGLSFVFLAQWMAGDVTNLVGCVLTAQLPFQIAIATYFCGIDACILAQYFYYWHRDRRRLDGRGRNTTRAQSVRRGMTSRSTSTARLLGSSRNMMMSSSISSLASSAYSASLDERQRREMATSTKRDVPSRRGRSLQQHRPSQESGLSRADVPRLKTMQHSYRALENAAMSVAELAHQADIAAARRDARRRLMRERMLAEASRGPQSKASSDESDVEGSALQRLHQSAASLASVQSSPGPDVQYGMASVPDLRNTTSRAAGSSDAPLSPTLSPRGRRGRMSRTASTKLLAEEISSGGRREAAIQSARPKEHHSTTRSTRRGTSLARRNTGLVFLGVTALFGFAPMAPSNPQLMRPSEAYAPSPGLVIGAFELSEHIQSLSNVKDAPTEFIYESPDDSQHEPELPPDEPPADHVPPQSWNHFIGRISAWICAMLYVTSRLPQIWVNMNRRSVQGLSIMLFVAAAMGNLLYTLSILVNPLAHSPPSSPDDQLAFLLESMPFVIGSGGTLIFDAIIVAQWLAWRGKEPVPVFEGDDLSVDPHHGARGMYGSVADLSRGQTQQQQHINRRLRSASRVRTQSRWQSLERQPLLE